MFTCDFIIGLFSPKERKHCDFYLSVWKTTLKHSEDALLIFIEWMNERILCTLASKQLWPWWQRCLVHTRCPGWGNFQRKCLWCIFLVQLVSPALTHLWAVLRYEWENRDASSNLLLKKIIQSLLGVVCPLRPRSPFLNSLGCSLLPAITFPIVMWMQCLICTMNVGNGF